MKSFRFANIWLLSLVERKATHVSFHPHKNLILGRNHTGKTSLIRSLFETLGAKPVGKLERWTEGTISLVEFSIDERQYFAVHQLGRRALFDSNKKLIAATSKHSEWSRLFGDIASFNLVFSDRESEVQPADPSCFFVPFYINQDGSWQAEWNTFTGMRRFSSPWKPILEYFTGTCPAAYYQAKAERDKASKELEEQKREAKLLERTRLRFSKTLPQDSLKLDPKNFENEIALLTKKVSELNRQQEEIRSAVAHDQDLLSSLELQIRMADEALGSYQRDTQFLRSEPAAPLICPTCRAEHSKTFLDILSYTEDARVLQEIKLRLQSDASEMKRRVDIARGALGALDDSYAQVSKVLDTRRGELKFQDVVDSAGAESAFAAFESERAELQTQIDKLLSIVDQLDDRMASLRNRKVSKEILDSFRDYYSTSRSRLGLPAVDTSKLSLTSRPELSGSGGPRSILAYYAAIWKTSFSERGDFRVPIVIDSPNQQGQDDINLPKVLKFIANDLPQETQLIVGLEAEADLTFDYKLVLDKPYELLSESELQSVSAIVEPMVTKMLGALETGDTTEPLL